MPTINLTTAQTTAILILWAAWALLLFGGFATGRFNEAGTHRIPTRNRMASSFALVIAASAWSLMASGPLREVSLLIALGMALGFLGDLFMAGLIIQGDNRVLGGMASFGVGHLVYIGGIVHFANRFDHDGWGGVIAALVVWWIIAAVLWFIVVYRGAAERSALHLAALPYALLLASTAGVATGVALQTPGMLVLAAGAVLFLLSDLLLAAQLFNGLHFRGIGDAVWLMYGPGQMLIVYALPLASLSLG